MAAPLHAARALAPGVDAACPAHAHGRFTRRPDAGFVVPSHSTGHLTWLGSHLGTHVSYHPQSARPVPTTGCVRTWFTTTNAMWCRADNSFILLASKKNQSRRSTNSERQEPKSPLTTPASESTTTKPMCWPWQAASLGTRICYVRTRSVRFCCHATQARGARTSACNNSSTVPARFTNTRSSLCSPLVPAWKTTAPRAASMLSGRSTAVGLPGRHAPCEQLLARANERWGTCLRC